jgi:hypothetical protein
VGIIIGVIRDGDYRIYQDIKVSFHGAPQPGSVLGTSPVHWRKLA